MLRYAEAITDMIYKGFCWIFGRFFCWHIAEANWKILNLPRHFIADVLRTWILKTVYVSLNHWTDKLGSLIDSLDRFWIVPEMSLSWLLLFSVLFIVSVWNLGILVFQVWTLLSRSTDLVVSSWNFMFHAFGKIPVRFPPLLTNVAVFHLLSFK